MTGTPPPAPAESGRPRERLDGPAKVAGRAPYAYEQPVEDPLFLFPVRSTIARGRVRWVDTEEAEAVPGVVAVLTHLNAPRLASRDDLELWVLQDDEVRHHGQFVGAVIAGTPEVARHAASLVKVEYQREWHDVVLRADHPERYRPDHVNPSFDTDTSHGDVDGALADAAATVDQTYRTPVQHHVPMEPHTTVVRWPGAADLGAVAMYDSNQGVSPIRKVLAPLLDLDPEQLWIHSPHVGGAFGSKASPKAHHVLTALAARLVPGRPVKCALTRQQMFGNAGHRTPTIQRVRLGADRRGRLTAIAHDVVEHTARFKEFAEQTAVATRTMYAAEHRRTTHRLVPLDVPAPVIMRAPGEAPGMFALESAMDELAVALGMDPVELRIRNEPDADPESGLPFSTRHLARCLREGATRFGWADRPPAGQGRRDGDWLVGVGMAASTYPLFPQQGSRARIRALPDGRRQVEIAASDLGTGTWTALTQIAADALRVPAEAVDLVIGDSALPATVGAGGSSGLSIWGTTVVAAARAFRDRHGDDPPAGAEVVGELPENTAVGRYALHAFGAQFAEVRVDAVTGEIRVPRMVGVFDVGRVINPRTARSQLMGGMTMGLSMALHEESVVDPRFGHVVNGDYAGYHIPTNADVGDIDVSWLDEPDPLYNPMGSKGIGEIGIVGTAAAVANAVWHATGVRVRDVPITPDRLLGRHR
ncbi:xanthine dehydrogenase family protein molybdopterin-binding subunit [Actinoalloteichus caeruleus]|uniref:xanthine dehydrogenase family protein molybdopterin-binding subunit n=2 Tax=Actinoalloteichus cyanogriseus TaxID=2893586 RepID=UPI0004C145E9|nr:xanthine dehydrogenase family protein molybdopterin-binding subunit [Actinoalloteichus caeruleus]